MWANEKSNEMNLSEILCEEHQGAHTAAAHKCSLCPNDTNSCYMLCTVCAVQNDECQECRTKMNMGIDSKTVNELVETRTRMLEKVAQAEVEFQAAIAPLADAIAAFTKADNQAGEEFRQSVEVEKAACEQARQAWCKARESDVDTTEAKAALDAAGAALKPKNEFGYKLLEQRRKETDAIFGAAREQYEQATRTLSSTRWKAERVMDASINRVLGHIGVEMGYTYELKRIEEQA